MKYLPLILLIFGLVQQAHGATLKDLNDLNKNEYSTTLGLNINFSAK